MSTPFLHCLLRMKLQLNIETDRDVAAVLGMSFTAFNDRKRRSAFPVDRLYAVAQRRPELGLDVAYILGDASTAAQAPTPTAQPADSAAAQLHAHTLNRIVPAMADGFTVQTRYGELAIEPGPLAERIRDLVALHAELGLIAATGQEVR